MARKSRLAETKTQALGEQGFYAGIYARLSVEDHDDFEQNSIGNQQKIVQSFLAEHTEIEAVEYYADNGFTGMNFARPAFQQMLHDLRRGKINCVIVKDISRLGRHFVQTGEYVEKIFPQMGVRLICVNDDYDSAENNNNSAELLMPIKMVMNDSYVRDISQKINSSIHAKMKSGEYLPASGSIPYGYKRDEANHTFARDEETAPIVRRIFLMRAQGESINNICHTLNEEQIPSPGRLRFMRGETKAAKYEKALWSTATVRKILADRVYIGDRVHGRIKRSHLGTKKVRQDESAWQIIEHSHEAIVSAELFAKVQQLAVQKAQSRNAVNRQETIEPRTRGLLQDLIYCGDCGQKMRACKGLGRADNNGGRQAFLYYECGRYLDSARSGCQTHYIRAEEIIAAVQHALLQQLQTAQGAAETARLLSQSEQKQQAGKRFLSLRTKKRFIEKSLEQLIRDVSVGAIDKASYDEQKMKLKQELQILISAEKAAKQALSAEEQSKAVSAQRLALLKDVQIKPQLDRDLLRKLVEKIFVYPDKHIEIKFNYRDPYQGTAEDEHILTEKLP